MMGLEALFYYQLIHQLYTKATDIRGPLVETLLDCKLLRSCFTDRQWSIVKTPDVNVVRGLRRVVACRLFQVMNNSYYKHSLPE